MNTKDLTVSDFPGIDEAKFIEWKALQIPLDRESRIVTSMAIIVWFFLVALIPGVSKWMDLVIFIISLAVAYGFYLARSKRLRQLRKELKISDRLWARKKGRAFTG